jgi:curved DNA-binding protein CbpA
VQDTPKRKKFTKSFLFELFDIKPGFDERDLKRGYRKAAMQYHPDHGGRAEQFRAVEEAYRWLGDTRGIPGHRGWVYAAYADARYDLDLPEIDAMVKGFYEQICESAAV